METTQTTEAAKMTAVEKYTAAGFEARAAKYDGRCAHCRAQVAAKDARIVRNTHWGAFQRWEVVCKRVSCTDGYLAFVARLLAGPGKCSPDADDECNGPARKW